MIDRRTLTAGLAAGFLPAAAEAAARWQACADIPWPVQEVYGAAFRGQVVIAGGMAPGVQGLRGGINPQDRTGVYDPKADAYTTKKASVVHRSFGVAAPYESKVYLFGGLQVNQASDAVDEYNPLTDTWATKSSAGFTARQNAAAAAGRKEKPNAKIAARLTMRIRSIIVLFINEPRVL